MMKKYSPWAQELKIAYIGGGSRGWAWGFMADLALDRDICGTVRLYDIDRQAAERNRIIGGKIGEDPAAVSRWTYTVCDSLEEALEGADFVVISILPVHLKRCGQTYTCRNASGFTSRSGIRSVPADLCAPCARFPCL